jgi:pyruvate, orthophosphate dikinase
VRSGARASMPGMMDTVLNLGLNDATVRRPRQAAPATRASPGTAIAASSRCTANVVLGVDHHRFEEISSMSSSTRRRHLDTDLTPRTGAASCATRSGAEGTGKPFPQDPREQLWGAIGAVFGSWMNQRAITYRKLHDIPADWGTAVNVQAMVFGNMGDDCATGVASRATRRPARTSSTANT